MEKNGFSLRIGHVWVPDTYAICSKQQFDVFLFRFVNTLKSDWFQL
jgi:hypothetical protein